MRQIAVAVLLALGASACVHIFPEPPPAPTIFSLVAAPAGPASSAIPKDVVISVATPTATSALSGNDIAWRTNGTLAFVEGASWEGRKLDLLQNLLVHTIDRRGTARGAVRYGEGSSNAEIRWDLMAFEVVEAGDLKAHMQVSAKLFDARTRRLIAAREFEENVPMSGRSMAVAAAALEQVAQQAAAKITDWAVDAAPTPTQNVEPELLGKALADGQQPDNRQVTNPRR
jgi:ABC-type uncharacterized transport system auxiliary subunit